MMCVFSHCSFYSTNESYWHQSYWLSHHHCERLSFSSTLVTEQRDETFLFPCPASNVCFLSKVQLGLTADGNSCASENRVQSKLRV